jgi:hypothetical protein
MIRKSRRSAAPGLQYARMPFRIDNFSMNSEVLSPRARYWSKLNGWKSHAKAGKGFPAAAAAAAMAFARSLRFSFSENVADPPSFSAACRRRAATREDRIEMTIAVLRGTGSKWDGASKNAKRSPGRFSPLGIPIGASKAQSIPAALRSSRTIIFLTCSYRDTQPQGARWQLSVAWSPSESIGL